MSNNIDESLKQCAEGKKPDTKEYYMSKNRQNSIYMHVRNTIAKT